MKRILYVLSVGLFVVALVGVNVACAARAAKGRKGAQTAAKPANEAGAEEIAAKPAGDNAGEAGVEPAQPAESSEKQAGSKGAKHSYPADYKPQIKYGKDDLIGVTSDGTLSCRYRGDWNDPWGKYLESYFAEAKASASARGNPTPKKAVFAVPILKDCEITAGNGTLGGDGQPLRGIFNVPEDKLNKLHEAARQFADFFYAASDGKVVAEIIFPVIEGLKVKTSPKSLAFLIWARGLKDQLEPMLKQYENTGVTEWIFVCDGNIVIQNPPKVEGKKKVGFSRGPFGLSFTGYALYGGYTMTTTAASPGLWVHEFNHRYLDGLREHAGVQVTKMHSQGMLGYAPGHNLDEIYFGAYRYLIRPAMWDRFSSTVPVLAPLEPFNGKAYAWKDVQDDCWFKTPELTNSALAQLTGIPSFEIDTSYGGSARLFKVAEADRVKVLSTYIEPPKPWKGKKGETPPPDAPPPPPIQLDNLIQCGKESCAVMKTASGTWFFVMANVADLYADMLKISGKGEKPLEVYGYVNKDVLPLVVLKGPADMVLPKCEEGFFRDVK